MSSVIDEDAPLDGGRGDVRVADGVLVAGEFLDVHLGDFALLEGADEAVVEGDAFQLVEDLVDCSHVFICCFWRRARSCS